MFQRRLLTTRVSATVFGKHRYYFSVSKLFYLEDQHIIKVMSYGYDEVKIMDYDDHKF